VTQGLIMNRIRLFAILLLSSVLLFAAALLWYSSGFQPGNGTFSGMMGQMMGGQFGGLSTGVMPTYALWTLLALAALTIAGVIGLAYYLAVPQIRTVDTQGTRAESQSPPSGTPPIDWGVLVRTSKPDEKKVLEVLAAHNGSYLQKFIVKESGLSKLQTHRIISRFTERGVVTATKSGNTNEISLASWLIQHASEPKL
jgi:hypothetical protein